MYGQVVRFDMYIILNCLKCICDYFHTCIIIHHPTGIYSILGIIPFQALTGAHESEGPEVGADPAKESIHDAHDEPLHDAQCYAWNAGRNVTQHCSSHSGNAKHDSCDGDSESWQKFGTVKVDAHKYTQIHPVASLWAKRPQRGA